MKALTAPFILPISAPPIKDGAIVFDESRIFEVGPKESVLSKYPEAVVEDFPHHVLMPGLINAHTHLDLIFLEMKGESPNFYNWIVTGWNYRKQLNPMNRRHSFEEGTRPLLRSGCTCVGDAGQYTGVIAQIVNSSMRMVLFPELLTGGDAAIQE